MDKFRVKKLMYCVGLVFFSLSCQYKDNKINQSTKFDKIQKKESDKFIELDKMAEFPGGEIDLMSFIEENINMIIVGDSTLTEGFVVVTFSVDTIGNINEFTVVKSYSRNVDKEVLRVLKLMPKWKPGEFWSGNKNDSFRKIKSKYTFPLSIPFKGYSISIAG
jgi:hypothetical protein